MAQLLTQLNKTQGNYQTVFIYTVNASFNGIEEELTSAQIRILFPDFLNVYLGDIQDPIQEITSESTTGGTLYTFNLGSISDLGIALRFGIGAMFSPLATNETKASIAPELWINGQRYLTSSSEPIQLLVSPNFRLLHELLLPDVLPTAGGIAYYRVLLKNYGDLGGAITNVEINCYLPEGFEIDTTYAITGKDISSNSFQDLSQDGVLGTISERGIAFSITEFHGEAYTFVYRVLIADEVASATEYLADMTWSSTNISPTSLTNLFLTSTSIYQVKQALYGPDYCLPSRLINYEASLTNYGNQDLTSVIWTITIPTEIVLDTFTTGQFYLAELEDDLNLPYTISYTSRLGERSIIGTYNTDSNTTISVQDFMSSADAIAILSWEFPDLPIGFTPKTVPLLDGTVISDAIMNSTLLCQLDVTDLSALISGDTKAVQKTLIQDSCVLKPIFSSSAATNPLRPGETFQYTIGANCRRSRLNAPEFRFYLPKELIYLGNISGTFYDYFGTQGSLNVPEPLILSNVNERQDSLVIFSFTDNNYRDFEQKSRIRITFDVQVLTTAKGELSSFFLLRSPSAERDEDATSRIYQNSILFFLSISSQKEVKGLLDSDFISNNTSSTKILGTTLSGEEVSYRITITNTGNADLNHLEIIDILPHINDTGIIEESILRGSQFSTSLTTEITAYIRNPDGYTLNNAGFDIYYSQNTDPIRFGNQFNTIGSVDDWDVSPPDILSSARSIKITTRNTTLLPGETLTLLFKTTVPYGVPVGVIAWNSFAADVVYTNTKGQEQHLLAIEPNKVGIQIAAPDMTKGRISGFVFWDNKTHVPNSYRNSYKTAYTGSYLDDSQRIARTNDIGVVLYNKNGIPLRTTFTSNDINGVPGQYAFSNLEIDGYYLRFFIDTDVHDFSTIQSLDLSSNYSMVNSLGITPFLDLNKIKYLDNIIAGIHSNTERRVNEILETNRNSNHMIRNVIYDQMLIGMKMEDTIGLALHPDYKYHSL